MGRIRRILKDFLKLTLAFLYSPILFLTQKNGRSVILYYHEIRSRDIRKFEKQIRYLAKHHRAVTVSEILQKSSDKSKSRVAITFDDAFQSVYALAVPVLRKYGMSAGIFVPAGNLGENPHWQMYEEDVDQNEVIMTPDQIREIDQEGFEIYSHTFRHGDLTRIEGDHLLEELTRSRQILETIVGHAVQGISYPYGAYNENTIRAAQKAGFQYGFTIDPFVVNAKTEHMCIGRVAVSPGDGLFKFRLKAAGAYQAGLYLRNWERSLLQFFRGRN